MKRYVRPEIEKGSVDNRGRKLRKFYQKFLKNFTSGNIKTQY